MTLNTTLVDVAVKTHLEAACRSIVATYSGEIVQVPACLVQP